jgi:hypothetical protein
MSARLSWRLARSRVRARFQKSMAVLSAPCTEPELPSVASRMG